ncbi:helix-turn-helix domain-containing protein [Pseudoalteromonas sp. T1lg75]|nr:MULTISPECIES: helix-turn-helix transcriptional regulator [unclassified Pseudoalteromonas]MBS3797117.1 helix-turn-helix transcriptional regulator [Pseudoalteromonas sp. BDTF-M6]
MIKKLREQKQWSQEQLATVAGLSARTIQRLESGNKASLESLKALASVFEVDIEILTKEITVIDKESQSWQVQPRWYKSLMWGVSERKPLAIIEYISVAAGAITWILQPNLFAAPALFLCAYLISKLIHRTEQQKFW